MVKLQDIESKLNEIKSSHQEAPKARVVNYSRLLIDLLSGLLVGAALGYLADNFFGTLPIFLFIFTILGTTGGYYNFYKEITKQETNSENKDA